MHINTTWYKDTLKGKSIFIFTKIIFSFWGLPSLMLGALRYAARWRSAPAGLAADAATASHR
jgi:zona occludens toxin (predicted ATPase)